MLRSHCSSAKKQRKIETKKKTKNEIFICDELKCFFSINQQKVCTVNKKEEDLSFKH